MRDCVRQMNYSVQHHELRQLSNTTREGAGRGRGRGWGGPTGSRNNTRLITVACELEGSAVGGQPQCNLVGWHPSC